MRGLRTLFAAGALLTLTACTKENDTPAAPAAVIDADLGTDNKEVPPAPKQAQPTQGEQPSTQEKAPANANENEPAEKLGSKAGAALGAAFGKVKREKNPSP